jgi:hypothetical protein
MRMESRFLLGGVVHKRSEHLGLQVTPTWRTFLSLSGPGRVQHPPHLHFGLPSETRELIVLLVHLQESLINM